MAISAFFSWVARLWSIIMTPQCPQRCQIDIEHPMDCRLGTDTAAVPWQLPYKSFIHLTRVSHWRLLPFQPLRIKFHVSKRVHQHMEFAWICCVLESAVLHDPGIPLPQHGRPCKRWEKSAAIAAAYLLRSQAPQRYKLRMQAFIFFATSRVRTKRLSISTCSANSGSVSTCSSHSSKGWTGRKIAHTRKPTSTWSQSKSPTARS